MINTLIGLPLSLSTHTHTHTLGTFSSTWNKGRSGGRKRRRRSSGRVGHWHRGRCWGWADRADALRLWRSAYPSYSFHLVSIRLDHLWQVQGTSDNGYNTTKCKNKHLLLITFHYCRTGFNCENLIIANCDFSRVCELLICKLIPLIAHPYVQFVQTQLLNSQCS